MGGYGYAAQVNTYNQQIAQNRDHIENLANKGLAELALIGPGEISKRPNLLTFCADGADKLVPRSVTMQNVGMLSRAGFDEFVEGYQWIPPWILEYPLENKGGNMIQRIKIDWVFIGILMSFFVILFTFDAIAGERARGTLSLMMSNAVSRGQMLLGKYLGAFVTVFLPLIISILINLLVIHFFGNIPFASEHWLQYFGDGGVICIARFHFYLSRAFFLQLCLKRHYKFGMALAHLGVFGVYLSEPTRDFCRQSESDSIR